MYLGTKRPAGGHRGPRPVRGRAAGAQAAKATPVAWWRPPLPGTEEALAAVMADPRGMPDANAQAATRLNVYRPAPRLAGHRARRAMRSASNVASSCTPARRWPGFGRRGPVRRGRCWALLVYEGMADSRVEAGRSWIANGAKASPRPIRGTRSGRWGWPISPSMPVFVMHDEVFDLTTVLLHAQRGPGQGVALRRVQLAGRDRPATGWLERILAPVLSATLQRHGPVDLPGDPRPAIVFWRPGVTTATGPVTSIVHRDRIPSPILIEVDLPTADLAAALPLSSTQTTTSCSTWRWGDGQGWRSDSARDIPGSTMVVAMARNGTEFGIQQPAPGTNGSRAQPK